MTIILTASRNVFTNKHLLKKIYSYIPGRSAINWKNGILAIRLGYFELIKQFGSNMRFSCNATQIAAKTSNFEMFKWVVINVGSKQNNYKDWVRTLETLALTNKKTMLRWLIRMASPDKLNFELYWSPDMTFERVIQSKHYDMIKWMSIHSKGIQTENITIEPIEPENLTNYYMTLLSTCKDISFLSFIFDKIKYGIILSDIIKRCIKKNQIEVAHHIFKNWSTDDKIDFLYNSGLCRSCTKLHKYLMIEDHMKNLPMSNTETLFRAKNGNLK